MIKHVQVEQRADEKWWIHPTGTATNLGPFDSLSEAKVKAYLAYPMALIEVYELDND